MSKIRTILLVVGILASPSALAHSNSEACHTVAQACLDAGFSEKESADKGIWRDCMNPIILGQSVSGVKVDAATAKTCRVDKIKDLKEELKDLQKAN